MRYTSNADGNELIYQCGVFLRIGVKEDIGQLKIELFIEGEMV